MDFQKKCVHFQTKVRVLFPEAEARFFSRREVNVYFSP